MPKHKCPFPDCMYETEDLTDTLAAVMLTIHNGTHTTHANTGSPSQTSEKIRRPTLSTGGSSEEWSYFLTRWQDYADATKIQGKEKVLQLLECCDEHLRKDLTRSAGGSLANKPIDQVMSAIKKLAVREENTMVARVQLHNMQQDRDEPIRGFGARLRGQAGVCKFTAKCPNCEGDVDYTEHIIRDEVTRGLADNDIQLDLLGDKNQNMSLEDVFQFIEAKEAGKRSAGRLLEAQATNATRSQYRRTKQEDTRHGQQDKEEKCHYCGLSGHGKHARLSIRKTACPAYGKTCGHCGRPNHLEAVCQQKEKPKRKSPPRNPATEAEGAVFNSLCTTSNTEAVSKSLNLDHHLYNHLNDRWVRQASKPQPFITLTVTVCAEDYKAFGFTAPTIHRKSIDIPAMADTGCQSCLAGKKIIQHLGLQEKDLIPVTMKMYAANNKGIKILGAAILRFYGKSTSGDIVETRQITYITDDSDKLFLSREACMALGMITKQFPTVGETTQSNGIVQPPQYPNPDHATTSTASCNCPKRQMPPPRPNKLPYPATEANRPLLQQWLLDYYASSTFNTCDHQPLPLMHSPPMRLMVDPDATPVAHHNPIPVPLHWQDKVKADLDRDVKLGVLEPVPVGEPVTWCHAIEWSFVRRKMGNHAEQSTSRH